MCSMLHCSVRGQSQRTLGSRIKSILSSDFSPILRFEKLMSLDTLAFFEANAGNNNATQLMRNNVDIWVGQGLAYYSTNEKQSS